MKTAAIAIGAWFAAAVALGPLIGRWLARRAPGQDAPAADPVTWAKPPRQLRILPAPNPPGHPPRRLRKRIDVMDCGLTHVYDTRTGRWDTIGCDCPPVSHDWDAGLRELTDGH